MMTNSGPKIEPCGLLVIIDDIFDIVNFRVLLNLIFIRFRYLLKLYDQWYQKPWKNQNKR